MFQPKYNQPFTLQEALLLDPPILTEEIARLQHSIVHLQSSNQHLALSLEEEHDADLFQALEENKVTMSVFLFFLILPFLDPSLG